MSDDTFPRQFARTQRFTLGEPRNVTVTPDGRAVVFARSSSGDNPTNDLWLLDVESGIEHLVADARALAEGGDLPPAERARRERLREAAGGVTSFSLDANGDVAAFALAGQLIVSDLRAHSSTTVPTDDVVFDPQIEPHGSRIAFVSGATLRLVGRDGSSIEVAREPHDVEAVSWGSAEFIAAEEMGRQRGFWWSPDGEVIAACRVDIAEVPVWHIANPASPSTAPTAIRYPAAGSQNADVSLHLCQIDEKSTIEVRWDRSAFPYLADVHWNQHGMTIVVQSRDQRDLQVRKVDTSTGLTELIWADHDDVWVELVPGTGALLADRNVVMCADRGGTRRLMMRDEPVSPDDVQVRSVIFATADDVLLTGNPIDDPTVQHVYRWSPERFEAITSDAGVHSAARGGDVMVVRSANLRTPGGTWRLPDGAAIAAHPEVPLVRPNVHIDTAAPQLATAVLLPANYDGTPLPVLLDPYGGPHAQRVVQSHNAFLSSQWFADQGFAVVIIDGRGTPGRGTDFERAVHHDFVTGVLDDQVRGLNMAAERHPELDLSRVAIRGWSFGGYLAALAVLQRPDVFHAAISGAPVTDWRLYDTHYTERYLGTPDAQPDVYEANSLIALADRLTRPLLLIHGLADDNVVAAHTLQMSSALLAAGKPHEFLPLVGVTHMTPQEVVAENLLLHQLEFLRRCLSLATVLRNE
jgi:dipeptidyl-peptidase-4